MIVMTDYSKLLTTIESNLQCSLNRFEGVLREHGNSLKKLCESFDTDLELGLASLDNLDDLVRAREHVSALSQTQGQLVQAKQQFSDVERVIQVVREFAISNSVDAARRLGQTFDVPTEQAMHYHWVIAWAGVNHILTGQPPLKD